MLRFLGPIVPHFTRGLIENPFLRQNRGGLRKTTWQNKKVPVFYNRFLFYTNALHQIPQLRSE